MLEMKKIREIGAEKMMKTLEGHELGNNLFKEVVWGYILSGKYNALMEDGCRVDKRVKVFWIDESQIIDMFLQILQLTTEMRGSFVEDMF